MKKFETIIEEYNPILVKISRVYSTGFDFDDLHQEIIINIWKGYKNFKGDSKLSTWIYRVSLNTALTFVRNKKNQKKYHGDMTDKIIGYQCTENIEEKELEINRLYNSISKLKPDQKVLILLYLEQKSYKEISEITGLSISNIGVKINRIKKILYIKLKENER